MSSYAVVWREDEGPTSPGKLEVQGCALRLEGIGGARELPFAQLAAIRFGSAPNDRLDGRPALIIEHGDGRIVRICMVGQVGALRELVERLGAVQLRDSVRRETTPKTGLPSSADGG